MKMKKRFIALAGALLLMMIGTIVYVIVAGDVCTVKTVHTLINNLDADKISVEIDDPSVAEVVDIQVVDVDDLKAAAITFGSLEHGDTTARVYCSSAETAAKDEETTAEAVTEAQTEADEDAEATDAEEATEAEEASETVAAEKTDEVKANARTMLNPELKLHVNIFGTIFENNDLTFNGWELVMYECLGALLLVAGILIWSFVECYRNAWFSYAMVVYGGVAAFCFFTVLLTLYDLPSIYTMHEFLHGIADTGYWFAVVTAPLMILLCGAIAFSNIWLIRHEGKRPQNMLGIGLAAGCVAGLALVLSFARFFIRDFDNWILEEVSYSTAYVLSFMECMLLSTIVCAFLSTTNYPAYDKDYIMILGCGFNADGTLSPMLKSRVDAAIHFERKQYGTTGKHAILIPTGGQNENEVMSESEAMTRYLLQQGFPEEQIIMEDESANADESFEHSCDKIWEDSGTVEGVRAAFATSNYHVFHGYTLAEKHGLDAEGISSKTKWYFYPNAILREFAGLLANKKLQIIISIAVILVVYLIGVNLYNLRW